MTIDNKKRRQKPAVDLMMYGKVPPQAKELEEAILGAILIEKNAFDVVINILKPECFYVDANKMIFRAMQKLAIRNMPIDLLTVIQQLKENEELEIVGGPYYVTKLTNTVVSSANIETHSNIVYGQWVKRELIRLGGELINGGYDDSIGPNELQVEHEKAFTALNNDGAEDSAVMIDAALVKAVNRIEDLKAKDQAITGIPTGYFGLDRITHGWQDGDLIILAARPSVGKTAFALNIARHAYMNKQKPVAVALFSLEMSTGQLVNRLISAESGVWLDSIQTGKVSDDNMKTLYSKAVAPLSKGKLIIDDTPELNILTIKSKCRRLKRKHDIGLIIIDYLQLMSGDSNDGNNREREISRISRGLKGLAKELHVPVIALSQLSRKTEERKGDAKTPQLSDLRESGAIEQDADMVMFMYRPEYYGYQATEMGETTKGKTLISIAKHRNGNLALGNDAIVLKAELHIQKFVDWDGLEDAKQTLGAGSWRPVITPKQKEDSPF